MSSEEKPVLYCRAIIEIDFECEEVPSISQVLSNVFFDEHFLKNLKVRITQLSGEFEND